MYRPLVQTNVGIDDKPDATVKVKNTINDACCTFANLNELMKTNNYITSCQQLVQKETRPIRRYTREQPIHEWLQRVEEYSSAHNITDKTTVLLNNLDHDCSSALNELRKFKTMNTYEDYKSSLIDLFDSLYNRPNSTEEFYQRKQSENETTTGYFIELVKLAQKYFSDLRLQRENNTDPVHQSFSRFTHT